MRRRVSPVVGINDDFSPARVRLYPLCRVRDGIKNVVLKRRMYVLQLRFGELECGNSLYGYEGLL